MNIDLSNHERCNSCLHQSACESWIRHSKTLYSDYTYDVDNCPHYINSNDVGEIVHSAWIPNDLSLSESYHTLGVTSITIRRAIPASYRCSVCGRVEEYALPYCNCGAKMDLRRYIEI